MSTRTTEKRRSVPEKFAVLSARHPLRPIQDRVDLENAQEMTDALAVLPVRTKDQEDYLETLSTLIEKYEREQNAVDVSKLSAIEVLRFLMDGREMSASDLGRVLGNRELGAAILRGDRQLSKANIIRLSKHFAVSPALFLV
jgi:antitoxin component HigA of HigAB toxin-antitoxin module